jgi:hypothetical protein
MQGIIQDARTARTSEHSIQSSIVSGVLYDTGLPKINNIIHGPSKAHHGGHPAGVYDGGKYPAVIHAPRDTMGHTHQEVGMAKYLAVQSKGSRHMPHRSVMHGRKERS